MINQSFASNEGLIKENSRYLQSSAPTLERHVPSSRHLSFQHKWIPSNGRSRLVIYATIHSPTNNRRSKGSKSINSDHELHSVRYFFTIFLQWCRIYTYSFNFVFNLFLIFIFVILSFLLSKYLCRRFISFLKFGDIQNKDRVQQLTHWKGNILL